MQTSSTVCRHAVGNASSPTVSCARTGYSPAPDSGGHVTAMSASRCSPGWRSNGSVGRSDRPTAGTGQLDGARQHGVGAVAGRGKAQRQFGPGQPRPVADAGVRQREGHPAAPDRGCAASTVRRAAGRLRRRVASGGPASTRGSRSKSASTVAISNPCSADGADRRGAASSSRRACATGSTEPTSGFDGHVGGPAVGLDQSQHCVPDRQPPIGLPLWGFPPA